MRKNYFVIATAFLLVITAGCSKNATNAFNASVHATIGTAQFSSTKSNVNVGEDPITQGGTVGGTEQVTITGNSDASNGFLVIAFGYAANDVKTYSIANDEAICAYNSGSGSDDEAVSGSVTITANDTQEVSQGKHLTGTYDFTTQNGIHVTGDFSVQVNY